MAKFDWRTVIGAVAPTIATALGGPLAGVAVSAIAQAVLGGPHPDGTVAAQAEIEKIVEKGMTPDQLSALKMAEDAFVSKMKELDIEIDKLDVDDRKDARAEFAKNQEVTYLGFTVLAIFAAVIGGSLYACYEILVGGILVKDPGEIAAVFGVIGTIIGYVSAKADSVISYFFGSSHGSNAKTDAMSSAITNLSKP